MTTVDRVDDESEEGDDERDEEDEGSCLDVPLRGVEVSLREGDEEDTTVEEFGDDEVGVGRTSTAGATMIEEEEVETVLVGGGTRSGRAEDVLSESTAVDAECVPELVGIVDAGGV